MPDCNCPLTTSASLAPDAPAIALPGCTLSFATLDQMAANWTKRLHEYGMGEGDRVALFYPPTPELIALFFAIWRTGASFCPLNLRLPTNQIPAALSRLDAKLYITDSEIVERMSTKKVPLPPSAFLFTSGSTGNPKIAILPRENLLANARTSLSILNLLPGDRWLLSLPLYHVGGIGLVLRSILARATLSFDDRDLNITHLSYVPTHLYRASPVYRKLKCLLLGGAPISTYPENLPVFLTYGLTEMGSIVVVKKSPERIDRRWHLGNPLPGREIRINRENEILVKGKTLFLGYWSTTEIECPFDKEGWFSTGDLGCIDPEKGLSILGRKDWMFISGGENIQPEEIEDELIRIPDILEAVVISIDNLEFGKRPIAFIKTNNPDFDVEHAKTTLSAQLPKYKIPLAIYRVSEIPKNGLKADRMKIFENWKSFLS